MRNKRYNVPIVPTFSKLEALQKKLPLLIYSMIQLYARHTSEQVLTNS
jgi:hypothetical protein